MVDFQGRSEALLYQHAISYRQFTIGQREGMLVGRPTELGLFPGTYVQIYVFILNVDSPAYEHPMLDEVFLKTKYNLYISTIWPLD